MTIMTTKTYNLISILILTALTSGCAQESKPDEKKDKVHTTHVFYPVLKDTMDLYAKSKGVFLSDNTNDPALRYIDTGLIMYNKFKFDEAIFFYTKSIKVKPYSHAYSNRANARLAVRDTVNALQDYNDAIKADSTNSSPFFNRGNLFTAQKKYTEALTDYNDALKAWAISKNYTGVPLSDIFINRGNLLFYLNDLNSSIKDYSEALKSDPKNLMAFANRAEAKNKLRDFQGAIEDYSKAISINEDPEFFFKRAMNYINLQKFQEAIPDLDKTIKLNPTIWDAYYIRAQAKGRLKNYNAAIADIDKMIELQPNNAEGYFMRGLTYSAYLQNSEKGCPDLKKALDLGDKRAAALIRDYCPK